MISWVINEEGRTRGTFPQPYDLLYQAARQSCGMCGLLRNGIQESLNSEQRLTKRTKEGSITIMTFGFAEKFFTDLGPQSHLTSGLLYQALFSEGLSAAANFVLKTRHRM